MFVSTNVSPEINKDPAAISEVVRPLTFSVTEPDVPPPLKPVPAVTPVISPVPYSDAMGMFWYDEPSLENSHLLDDEFHLIAATVAALVPSMSIPEVAVEPPLFSVMLVSSTYKLVVSIVVVVPLMVRLPPTVRLSCTLTVPLAGPMVVRLVRLETELVMKLLSLLKADNLISEAAFLDSVALSCKINSVVPAMSPVMSVNSEKSRARDTEPDVVIVPPPLKPVPAVTPTEVTVPVVVE